MNQPKIEIKFGSCKETNKKIRSIWINSLNDAIKAAQGDTGALVELNRMAKEAVWLTDNLIYQAKGR